VRKISKRKIAATLAITAILVGGGSAAAVAYWSAGGSGSGQATTGTSTGITVNQPAGTALLTPGGTTQALSGTFSNSNSGPVTITSVTASVTGVTLASGITGTCSKTDYVVSGTAVLNSTTIPSGNNVGGWSGLTLSLTNTASNQDACKGATPLLTYVAS
jgi:hypothetical protein